MSVIADKFVGLAEELAEIIKNLPPNQLYWFLAEVDNGIRHGYTEDSDGLNEDTWGSDDGCDWFDIALYCVTHGAFFDDMTVESFLYDHELTKNICRNTTMYGKTIDYEYLARFNRRAKRWA